MKSIIKALAIWFILLMSVMTALVPAQGHVLALEFGEARLVLLPASQTVNVNTTFNVDIHVQANGELINGVAARLDFDPSKLGVNYLTPRTNWNGKTATLLQVTSLDNVTGLVDFSAGILGDTATGDFTIATVNFIAKATAANTSINFHFSSPPTRNTNIAGGGVSVLGTATGASLIITGASGSISQSPQLVSIAVTPPNPSVAAGLTRQFTAIGTYSDKSSADITNQVTWKSSNQASATIETTGKANPGLLTGLAAGTTTVTASLGALSAVTTLTVTKVEEKPVASPSEPKTAPTAPSTPPTSPSPGAVPGAVTPTGEPKTTNAPPKAPAQVPVTPGASQESPAAPAAMIDWRLIGGIGSGVVILIVIICLSLRRRA